jgi:hypothetical protein
MSAGNLTRLINTILLFVVGLLVGGITGYLVGQGRATGSPATSATTSAILNDVLPVEDTWIVAGFSCPMTGCTNPLLSCPGELPRRIRDWINQQRAAGRAGDEIRAEIIRVHGQNLYKLPGATPTDTAHVPH